MCDHSATQVCIDSKKYQSAMSEHILDTFSNGRYLSLVNPLLNPLLHPFAGPLKVKWLGASDQNDDFVWWFYWTTSLQERARSLISAILFVRLHSARFIIQRWASTRLLVRLQCTCWLAHFDPFACACWHVHSRMLTRSPAQCCFRGLFTQLAHCALTCSVLHVQYFGDPLKTLFTYSWVQIR